MDFQNILLKLFFKDDLYVIQSVILKVQRIPRMHEISKIHLWIEVSIMELRTKIQWVNQIVWWYNKWREVLCYKKFSGSLTMFLVFLIKSNFPRLKGQVIAKWILYENPWRGRWVRLGIKRWLNLVKKLILIRISQSSTLKGVSIPSDTTYLNVIHLYNSHV